MRTRCLLHSSATLATAGVKIAPQTAVDMTSQLTATGLTPNFSGSSGSTGNSIVCCTETTRHTTAIIQTCAVPEPEDPRSDEKPAPGRSPSSGESITERAVTAGRQQHL